MGYSFCLDSSGVPWLWVEIVVLMELEPIGWQVSPPAFASETQVGAASMPYPVVHADSFTNRSSAACLDFACWIGVRVRGVGQLRDGNRVRLGGSRIRRWCWL